MNQLSLWLKACVLRAWKCFDAHQRIALFYLLINLPILAILFGGAFNQKIQYTFTLFVCSLTASILLIPRSFYFVCIKKWFCWLDAVTPNEREAILCLKFNQIQRASDYIERTMPYLYRTGACGILLSILGASPLMANSNLSVLCGAVAFYLFGVLLTIIASILIFAPAQK
jgi:hypothetical protein